MSVSQSVTLTFNLRPIRIDQTQLLFNEMIINYLYIKITAVKKVKKFPQAEIVYECLSHDLDLVLYFPPDVVNVQLMSRGRL